MKKTETPKEILAMSYGRCSICGSDRTGPHPRFRKRMYCRSCRNALFPSELCPNDEQTAAACKVMRMRRRDYVPWEPNGSDDD